MWAIVLGFPTFILHMTLLDYEHFLHRAQLSFSVSESLAEIIPHHRTSLILWLSAACITVFAVRRMIRHQNQLVLMRERLTVSQTRALTDGLTGVWNRRGFDSILRSALMAAHQSEQPVSLILADVDGLKKHNDTHGHPAADEALRIIARTLASCVRSADAVARYGGDEFAIVCPALNREGSILLVERLQKALLSAPLTLSFGIATFPMDASDARSLIKVADSKMYEVKSQRTMNSTHDLSTVCCDEC
jgi:diguanylate cyclase (GGDEF)-like protein